MKMELLDRKQKRLGFWESIDGEFIKHILNDLSSKEDFTMAIEHDKDRQMYIAVNRGLCTLFVQLSDDEFYDYISTHTMQGDIEFVEGGQKVKFDSQHLASQSAVVEAIDNFARNPSWVRMDSNWQRQI